MSALASRHDISPSQLSTWRRLLSNEMEKRGIALLVWSRETRLFEAAVVEEQEPSPLAVPSKPVTPRRKPVASTIELEIGNAKVRIGSNADADIISAMITAIRASR